MRNPKRVLSKAQILDRVWNYDFGGQANVVELYISYLRKKVDAGREPMIHTMRGAGYVLKPARLSRCATASPHSPRGWSSPRSRWSSRRGGADRRRPRPLALNAQLTRRSTTTSSGPGPGGARRRPAPGRCPGPGTAGTGQRRGRRPDRAAWPRPADRDATSAPGWASGTSSASRRATRPCSSDDALAAARRRAGRRQGRTSSTCPIWAATASIADSDAARRHRGDRTADRRGRRQRSRLADRAARPLLIVLGALVAAGGGLLLVRRQLRPLDEVAATAHARRRAAAGDGRHRPQRAGARRTSPTSAPRSARSARR